MSISDKFNVGDVVELVDNSWMVAPVGSEAIVDGNCGEYVYVEWADKSKHCQRDGGYYPKTFKLKEGSEESLKQQIAQLQAKLEVIQDNKEYSLVLTKKELEYMDEMLLKDSDIVDRQMFIILAKVKSLLDDLE